MSFIYFFIFFFVNSFFLLLSYTFSANFSLLCLQLFFVLFFSSLSLSLSLSLFHTIRFDWRNRLDAPSFRMLLFHVHFIEFRVRFFLFLDHSFSFSFLLCIWFFNSIELKLLTPTHKKLRESIGKHLVFTGGCLVCLCEFESHNFFFVSDSLSYKKILPDNTTLQ